MTASILLYGATGFSGKLIIEEFMYQAKNAGETGGVLHVEGVPVRLVIAARERARLEEIADQYGVEYRAFALDDQGTIERGLNDIQVVINAAGPFASTGEALAKAALSAKVHYVDINGELDVYQRLDDLATKARVRECALVCGAGSSATASDLLLDRALATLAGKGFPKEVGAIRIAAKRTRDFSRGSAQTVWRSIREQVAVVRGVEIKRKGNVQREMRVTHEAVGRLERTFDFGEHLKSEAGQLPKDSRIATAVEAVDTLTAQRTTKRHGFFAQTIETYVDMGATGRLAYQVGALTAPIAAMTWVRELANFQINLLPPGPSESERDAQRHVVVLEIEDLFREKIIDLRFETPNTYQFTAQVVIGIASRLVSDRVSPAPLVGWLTPSQVLADTELAVEVLGRARPDAQHDGKPTTGIRATNFTDALSGVFRAASFDLQTAMTSSLDRLAPATRADAEKQVRDSSAPLRGCNINVRIGGT